MHSVDEKLVSQTLGGDRDAFGVLVHKYQEMVYTYAFQKVRNEADAQDIMQEIFLQAYRRLYQLRHPHLFRSWLYTIMSNECKRWLERVTKKRRREIFLEEATDDALRIEPAHALPVEGWQVDLEQALSKLPDESRVVVSMFYMGDCSLKDISEFLGVSVNTVKSKLRRARQQLGGALSEHYGRLLKSQKLRGGFLMHFMEQIRQVPAPTIGFAWSSASVGKAAFALITALCVLIGLIGVRNDFPTKLSTSQIGLTSSATNRIPIEVELLESAPYSTRSSVIGYPEPTRKRPLVASSHAPAAPGRDSTIDAPTSHGGGVKNPNARLSAGMVGNSAENLTFSGRVVDGGGEPVADAEILYSTNYNPLESATRTGADGTFRFECARPKPQYWHHRVDVVWDRADIVATHPQYASGWKNLRTQSAVDIEIRLEKPTNISGRVVNTAGDPIQNVEVEIKTLLRNDPMTLRPEYYSILNLIPIPTVKTDENGGFSFRKLPPGRMASVYVQGEGYASERHGSVPTGTEGLEWKLEHEARIEGRLTYTKTGAPVRRATVSAQGIHPTEGWAQASVDKSGHYSLKNLASGTYNVYLQDGPARYGPARWTASGNAVIKVVAGETVSNVDLTLVRVGFVTGRVTDGDTHEPIADHYIGFHDAARPESQVQSHDASTDKNGTYRFNAAPGRGVLIVTAPHGYQDVGHIRKNVDIVKGKTVAVDFQFSKGTPLFCRILTETGEPVSGARIFDPSGFRHEYGVSNEQGELSIHGPRRGRRLEIAAEHSELQLRGSAEVEIQPNASVEIRMKRYESVSVSGRVVNPEGDPIQSVNINRMRWDRERGQGIGSPVAVTDGEGRFRGVGLVVGDRYVISASAEGYWKAETEEFTATDEMSQIADFILRPAVGQYFIEGRVTDTTGKPVRGARIYTYHKSQRWNTVTDENGDYRFDNLLMNVIFYLGLHHPDYANHQFEILKTNQRHDLVLVKADGYLAGKVVDTDGKPMDRMTVTIQPQKNTSSSVVNTGVDTNGRGEFELKHISDPVVSIYVGNRRESQVFEDIKVNQSDVVLTFSPTESSSEPDPERQARWAYAKEAVERFKTLVGQPAPELAVSEWLSGTVSSIRNLKGSTIALDFWESGDSDNIPSVRLLNLLHDIYEEEGLVCITIIPAREDVGTVKQHIAEHSLRYSIGLDSQTGVTGAKGETFHRYAIGWSGSIVLINAAGEITGSVYPPDLGDQIQALFSD